MFNISLVLFREFDGFSSLETMCMEWSPFWIQIHELPLGLMNEKIDVAIEKTIGQVLETNANGEQVL